MNRTSRVTPNRFLASLTCAALVASLGACKTNATIDRNQTPEANAGVDQVLPYAGAPVGVVLDGRASRDIDGVLVKFTWLSGDAGDAGAGMDPDDIPTPTVWLEEGVWTFHLFVEDDEGSVSMPDTVVITVGEVAGPGCDLAMCMPALGAACCTVDTTGPGDSTGRADGLCGSDLGTLIPSLAGVCLQLNQPGAENAACPEQPNAAGQMEPGCCTEEGMCGSVNTSVPLGCHYPAAGPGPACTP